MRDMQHSDQPHSLIWLEPGLLDAVSPASTRRRGFAGFLADLRRFARSAGQARNGGGHGSGEAHAKHDAPTWLDHLLANPLACTALREHLGRRRGAEGLEFLVACRGYDEASNPLQRYQQLRTLIHRFVREHADRPIPLSPACRQQLLTEWARWAHEHRIAHGSKPAALEAAAAEIAAIVKARGPLSVGLRLQT
jgi:hypothetical protein